MDEKEKKEELTTAEDKDYEAAMELAKTYDEEGGNSGVVLAVVAGVAAVTGLALLAKKAIKKHKSKKEAEEDAIFILEDDEYSEEDVEEDFNKEPEDNDEKK